MKPYLSVNNEIHNFNNNAIEKLMKKYESVLEMMYLNNSKRHSNHHNQLIELIELP